MSACARMIRGKRENLTPHVDEFRRHKLYATGFCPEGAKGLSPRFNPGLGVLEERALKGHQTAIGEWTMQDKFMRAERIPSGATFRAHLFPTDNPGLKPRAESCRPFGTNCGRPHWTLRPVHLIPRTRRALTLFGLRSSTQPGRISGRSDY